MNCTSYSLTGLNAQCKNTIGGIQEIYIGKYANLFAFETKDGLAIPVMHRGSYQKLLKYKFRKNTASMTTNLVKNDNGADYFQTDLSLRFGKMETAKRIEVMALVNQDVFAIVKDMNGKYWLIGKDEPLQLSAAQGLTGNARTDANEYSFTLTDTSNEAPFEVSAETVNDLFTDWAKEPLTIEIINDNTDIRFFPKDSPSYTYSMLISKDKVNWVGLECDTDDSVRAHFGLLHTGDKIYFMMRDGYETPIDGYACLTADDSVYVYGSIASLFNEDYAEFAEGDFSYDGVEGMFNGLFDDAESLNQNENVLTHPTKELVLPWSGINTTGEYIYANLFNTCENVVYGPRIDLKDPIGGNRNVIFYRTFENCTSLKYLNANFTLRYGTAGAYYATTEWLKGANPNGIFVTSNGINTSWITPRNESTIPSGWKLELVNDNEYSPLMYDSEE